MREGLLTPFGLSDFDSAQQPPVTACPRVSHSPQRKYDFAQIDLKSRLRGWHQLTHSVQVPDMVLGSIPLLVLGHMALLVAGNSDASNCPDPEATEQLIAERTSDSAPSRHELHHEMVTDAQSGQSYVRVRLFNENQAILLERLIPVNQNDCSDVPLAIAIIVENYFGTLAPLTPPHDETPPLPTPPSVVEDNRPSQSTHRNLRIMSGLNLSQGGALSLEFGFGSGFGRYGFADIALNLQLYKVRSQSDDYLFAHTIQSLYLGSGVIVPFTDRLGLLLGPSLGVHYERAELRGSNVLADGVKARFIPSVGAKVQLSFDWGKRGWVGIGSRLNVWLAGSRFTVAVPNEAPVEVSPLPRLDWDGHLLAGVRF